MHFKGPTWLKPVHCMLKLNLKIGSIVCMSVQCVHGTQGEPGNEAMSTAYFHF